MRRLVSIAAAIIISLSLTSPSLVGITNTAKAVAGNNHYQYQNKINPYTGNMQPVPKGWDLKYNNMQRRWVWAPRHARLVYDMGLKEWRYIPGIIPR